MVDGRLKFARWSVLWHGLAAGAFGGIVVDIAACAITWFQSGSFSYSIWGLVALIPLTAIGALIGLASAVVAIASNLIFTHTSATARLTASATAVGAGLGSVLGFSVFWQFPFEHAAEWWIQIPAAFAAAAGALWLWARPVKVQRNSPADLQSLGDYYSNTDG